jgi:Uma2 family endonuclease
MDYGKPTRSRETLHGKPSFDRFNLSTAISIAITPLLHYSTLSPRFTAFLLRLKLLFTMSERPQAPSLTQEDYYNLPDNGLRYQLIEGELYMGPAPNLYHQTISGNLEFMFRSYLEQNPLGILLHAPADVVFHRESIWQPDIFVVLNANRHILKEQRCEGAPDFIVEILSPHNRELDLHTKRTIYARQGVTEYWIVDPDMKEVLIYRFDENLSEPVAQIKSPGIAKSPLFPGLTINLDAIFRAAR